MSLNLNKVILAGRMTADPELKQTQSGISMVSFSVAVNRKYIAKNAPDGQPEADFFRVTAWRTTAEFVAKYFHKGSAICVCGSIQNRNWTGEDGQKHYSTDIIADEVNFVEGKAAAMSPGERGAANAYDAGSVTSPKFEAISPDDDLPF